jgi:hypothetical protein
VVRKERKDAWKPKTFIRVRRPVELKTPSSVLCYLACSFGSKADDAKAQVSSAKGKRPLEGMGHAPPENCEI